MERTAAPRQDRRVSEEELLAWIEGLARDPRPDLPAGFLPAWGRYATARDRLAASGAVPPADYRPDLPAGRRLRLWVGWDAPEVDDGVVGLLEVIVAWGRR